MQHSCRDARCDIQGQELWQTIKRKHVIKNLSFSNDDLEDDVEWKLIGTMLFSVFCHENSQDLILILIAFVSVDL